MSDTQDDYAPMPTTLEALKTVVDGHVVDDLMADDGQLKTELNATYARFVDQNGNPLSSRHVVIKVDSTTGEIIDIVAEA